MSSIISPINITNMKDCIFIQTENLSQVSDIIFIKNIITIDIWANTYNNRSIVKIPKCINLKLTSSNILDLRNIIFNKKTRIINLSNNNIHSISNNNFPKLLESLILFDNLISDINYKYIPPKLQIIDIHYNPINYLYISHVNLKIIKITMCQMKIYCPKLEKLIIYPSKSENSSDLNDNLSQISIIGSDSLKVLVWLVLENKFINVFDKLYNQNKHELIKQIHKKY